MAGAIQLTEVDFEQIKLNLIDYLKSTRQFTDYDFALAFATTLSRIVAEARKLSFAIIFVEYAFN